MLKLLLVVVIVAVATYALVRVIQRRGVSVPPRGGASHPAGTRRPRPAPRRPLGPDDDEEFLRELERRRRERRDPDS